VHFWQNSTPRNMQMIQMNVPQFAHG
jgi:hypothetical protein